MRRFLVLAGAACVFVLAPRALSPNFERPVDAGSALRMDVQELVDGAQLVLEARVVSRRALVNAHGRVATELELDVLRTFLGQDHVRRTVRLPGGVLPDGSGVLLAGMPSVVQGEDVILFLSEEGAGGLRMPIGLAQGKLRVVTSLAGEKLLVRRSDGLELARAPGEPAGHALAQEHFGYAETVAEIHAAVERRRGAQR